MNIFAVVHSTESSVKVMHSKATIASDVLQNKG